MMFFMPLKDKIDQIRGSLLQNTRIHGNSSNSWILRIPRWPWKKITAL